VALGASAQTGAADTGRAEPVPGALVEIESAAEDTVDLALSGDRAGLVASAARLRALASGAGAEGLLDAGVPRSAVAELGRRATRVARVAHGGTLVRAALAANAVSGLMPGLYARFRDPVPPDVFRLDYLDREAQLRSLAGNRNAVVEAVGSLVATWAHVQPKVLRAGGSAQAAAYRAHVGAMRRLARPAGKRLVDEAVRGLALVDELERVFTG
jgi:hypothetical protein